MFNAGDIASSTNSVSSAHKALLAELRVNAGAHLRLTRRLGQRLAPRGRGGILLMSSVAGLQPVPFMAN